MSWANHLLSIKKKISKVIGILYRLKNTFPLEVLKTLYKSLVLSYINYGLLLWGVEVKNLEIIQKRAIRLITGSNYIAHTEPLFIQLCLLKVHCTPLYQLIKLINTLKTDKSDTILEKLDTQNCSYSGFSYHIVNRYLNAYDPNCKLKHCFVCIRI